MWECHHKITESVELYSVTEDYNAISFTARTTTSFILKFFFSNIMSK